MGRSEPEVQYQPGSHWSVGVESPGEPQYHPGVQGLQEVRFPWADHEEGTRNIILRTLSTKSIITRKEAMEFSGKISIYTDLDSTSKDIQIFSSQKEIISIVFFLKGKYSRKWLTFQPCQYDNVQC